VEAHAFLMESYLHKKENKKQLKSGVYGFFWREWRFSSFLVKNIEKFRVSNSAYLVGMKAYCC